MSIVLSLFVAALGIIDRVLSLYVGVLIAGAVLSWLAAFGVINTRNRFVQIVGDLIFRITEPALKPIRRFVPPMGGIDLSPLVLIFIIWFLQLFLSQLASRI